jgi:galactokinase
MIADSFQQQFGSNRNMRVFRAPGRVNLIGEHTDYNLGFVLPIALDLACFVATADAEDGYLRVYSEEKRQLRSWPVADLAQLAPAHDWTDYVTGAARELIRAGYPIQPKRLLMRSSVPEGSGLSSSAALEVSVALALLGGREIAPLKLAELCQLAETRFVGLPCGIMDQYISVFGRENAALKIDCRTLENEVVDLPDEIEIIAVNTMIKHELSISAYRERTQECAAAVDAIRRLDLTVSSLRDVTVALLDQAMPSMSQTIARRARHVITENERVGLFVTASRHKDLGRMGQLMVESHLSLQHDYQVSSPELDFLVDTGVGIDGVLGARMTGGAGERFRCEISKAYEERFGLIPQTFDCRPSQGAGEVKNVEKIPSGAALPS